MWDDPRYISSRLSSNSEADASELLDNLEEMFPLYYMDSDVISRYNFVPAIILASLAVANGLTTIGITAYKLSSAHMTYKPLPVPRTCVFTFFQKNPNRSIYKIDIKTIVYMFIYITFINKSIWRQ